jgi:hypothetical protein
MMALSCLAVASYFLVHKQETPDRVVTASTAMESSRSQAVIKKLGGGVSYFLIPHPDDEVSAWSLAQHARFPIFILMTRGEQSVHCDPLGGKGSEQCKAARVGSWHHFLDNYYEVQPQASSDRAYQLYVGDNSARLVFDFGDKQLNANEVESSITTARELGMHLGMPEEFIVSAGTQYGHPDHKAVAEGVKLYSFDDKVFVNGPLDPRTNFSLDVGDYTRLSACPDGTVNQAYGWLDPPCWRTETKGSGFPVLRTQDFFETQG